MLDLDVLALVVVSAVDVAVTFPLRVGLPVDLPLRDVAFGP